jgi:glycosyltransferase 2 family protein
MSWKALVGIVLSAFLIWFTLRDVPLTEVWAQVRQADLLLLGGAVFVATAGFFVRALRWKVLLHTLDPGTGLRARYAAVNIGFMANNLLPARVGEFARAYALARMEPRVTVSGAFGSLVVERVLDGLVLAAFLVGAVLSPGFPEITLGPTFMLLLRTAVVLLGAIVVLLAFLLTFPRQVVAGGERLARRLPDALGRQVADALRAFLDALGVVRNPRLLLLALAWSFGFWAFHGISFWLGMLAFDIHAGPVAAVFTEAVVGFGVALPAAPGFFGTFHASAAFALDTVYGVDAASTLAFAYGYHLGGFVPVTLIGLWYARRLGMSLADVRATEERVEAAVEVEHPDLAGEDR